MPHARVPHDFRSYLVLSENGGGGVPYLGVLVVRIGGTVLGFPIFENPPVRLLDDGDAALTAQELVEGVARLKGRGSESR